MSETSLLAHLALQASHAAATLFALGLVACSSSEGSADFGSTDSTAPAALSFVQDRTSDSTGRTLAVTFSERVTVETAAALQNYTVSGGVAVLSAELDPAGTTVALSLDAPAIPGDHVISVAGGIEDEEGNASAPVQASPITSTDTVAPSAESIAGVTLSGPENDRVVVTFSDDMLASEVEVLANWTLESPLGAPFDAAGATVSYEPLTRTATVVLDAAGSGQNLHTFDDVHASFTGMRDLGGNAIAATTFGATAVAGEVTGDNESPTLLTAVPGPGNTITLTFSEAVTGLSTEALGAGTEVVLTDVSASGSQGAGTTTLNAIAAAPMLSGLQAAVTFPSAAEALDTLRLVGVTDLAGNYLFSLTAAPVVAAQLGAPSLESGASDLSVISGENNDQLVVVFDQTMHPAGLTDPENYALSGAVPVDLSNARFEFNQTDAVTITFGPGSDVNLMRSETYHLEVNQVRSAQGHLRVTPDLGANIAPVGDATAPTVGLSDVRLDLPGSRAVIVTFDEAVSLEDATAPANYTIAGSAALEASPINPRTVRVVFQDPPVLADSLDIAAAATTDLAGNAALGAATFAIAAADVTAPTLVAVVAQTNAANGRDSIRLNFSEPIPTALAESLGNYSFISGAGAVDLSGAWIAASSVDDTVRIELAEDVRLVTGELLFIAVENLTDAAGNPLSDLPFSTAVGGDTIAPFFAESFVNLVEDASGTTVDVRFNEPMNAATTLESAHWSGSAGQIAALVTQLNDRTFRVMFSGPLAADDTINVVTPTDVAGNVGPTLSLDPVE